MTSYDELIIFDAPTTNLVTDTDVEHLAWHIQTLLVTLVDNFDRYNILNAGYDILSFSCKRSRAVSWAAWSHAEGMKAFH